MLGGRCLQATPNAAHHAIASLSLPSTRARLLPSLSDPGQPPLFITQNFDSLSPRALDALASQLSSEEMKVARERLIQMHGSAFRTICLQCKHVNFTYDTPLAPALENLSANNYNEKVIPIDELPRCGGQNWNGSNRFGRCGGLLRPGVVWFGEVPEGMGEIARVLNWTDVLIVVGSSLLVRVDLDEYLT
jgi:NAD-dependent protein deacetylase sirtuin 5